MYTNLRSWEVRSSFSTVLLPPFLNMKFPAFAVTCRDYINSKMRARIICLLSFFQKYCPFLITSEILVWVVTLSCPVRYKTNLAQINKNSVSRAWTITLPSFLTELLLRAKVMMELNRFYDNLAQIITKIWDCVACKCQNTVVLWAE